MYDKTILKSLKEKLSVLDEKDTKYSEASKELSKLKAKHEKLKRQADETPTSDVFQELAYIESAVSSFQKKVDSLHQELMAAVKREYSGAESLATQLVNQSTNDDRLRELENQVYTKLEELLELNAEASKLYFSIRSEAEETIKKDTKLSYYGRKINAYFRTGTFSSGSILPEVKVSELQQMVKSRKEKAK